MNNPPEDKNRRVLVIDDNRAIHEDFRKILSPSSPTAAALDEAGMALFGTLPVVVQETRFEIDSAYQGQEGVQMVAKALEAGLPYAMAFVDVRMPPGWDGVETTRKMWEIDPNLQVVLCTAYSDYSWEEMFEKLGHSDGLLILKKPFDSVEAFQLAHALTEKWWLQRQSIRKMEELEKIVAERTRELQWKSAFLEAQVHSSIDGILVVDPLGRKILQNQRFTDLLRIPPHFAADKDDGPQLKWVSGIMKNPGQFIEKVGYLNSHPDEVSRDEIELNDGAVLDRYSSPVTGNDGKYYGRIWTFRDITERKRAEEALKESEVRYHTLFENMLEGYAHCKILYEKGVLVDFIYLEVNSAFEKLSGLKDVAGKKVSDLIPGIRENSRELFETYGRVAATGIPERYETYLEGLGIWFSISVYSHDREHFIAVFDNITERKQAENALRESEARFSGAFEFAPIGVALASPDGRWLKVNRVLCDLVGYSEGELLARTFQEITHPGDLDADLEKARQTLAGDIHSYQIEKRYVHAQGHLVTVLLNVSLVRDDRGQPLYFIAQIQDITERKRTEASRDRLVAILEATPDLVSIYDPGGNLTYLNRAGRTLLGVGMDEDITKTRIADFIPEPASHPILTVGIPSAVRQGIWSGETMLLSRFGHGFLVSQVIISHKSPEGKIEFLSTIMRDMTQRKKEEAQLFQSQKMETVGKLAGGIAHEFNSIMTAIIGQSELLLNGLPPGDPLCNNANEIHMAAERAAILTRQLLAYGRKQILQPEILDLNSVLARMKPTLHHLVGLGTDVRIVSAAGLKTVKADAGQIEQVIMNIVMNAGDAMPQDGKLTLETANVTLDQEYVSGFPDVKAGEYVMLAITDTGTGISETVKSRIFEPFFSTKPVGQGTGLGLSTCYGIVKQSGGHIGVYSELGRGSTFKVYLPQVEQQAHVPIQRIHATDLPRGTETVLLVDDDPALRIMSTTLLRRLGYTVLAAADGVEALGLKQQDSTGHVDLLFTDVVMPHMSGKELAARVSALYPQTRILFTSAYTENAIVHQGVLDEGVALLQKPFTPSALAHKLREVLDQTKMREAPIAEV